MAKNRIGTDAATYSKNKLFGLKPCGVNLGSLLAKHLIIDAYECTGFEYLNTEQKDCVVGKLTADLTSNCCS